MSNIDDQVDRDIAQFEADFFAAYPELGKLTGDAKLQVEVKLMCLASFTAHHMRKCDGFPFEKLFPSKGVDSMVQVKAAMDYVDEKGLCVLQLPCRAQGCTNTQW